MLFQSSNQNSACTTHIFCKSWLQQLIFVFSSIFNLKTACTFAGCWLHLCWANHGLNFASWHSHFQNQYFETRSDLSWLWDRAGGGGGPENKKHFATLPKWPQISVCAASAAYDIIRTAALGSPCRHTVFLHPSWLCARFPRCIAVSKDVWAKSIHCHICVCGSDHRDSSDCFLGESGLACSQHAASDIILQVYLAGEVRHHQMFMMID